MWPQRIGLLPWVPSSQLTWIVDQVVAHNSSIPPTSVGAVRVGIEAEVRRRLTLMVLKRNKLLSSCTEIEVAEATSVVVINNTGSTSPLPTPVAITMKRLRVAKEDLAAVLDDLPLQNSLAEICRTRLLRVERDGG